MASTRPACPSSAAFTRGVAILAAVAGTVAAVVWPVLPAAAGQTFDSALFALINQDRAAHGLAGLHWSGALGTLGESAPYGGCGFAVSGRAEDMIRRNYFAHPIAACGGRNAFDMMRAGGIGFSAAGENIGWAAGLADPVAAAQYLNQRFMASPEHAANILDPAYTAVGTGSWWTRPGQTWTGAGAAYTGVVMAAEEFIGVSPHAATAPAPAPAHRPVPATHGMNTLPPARPGGSTPRPGTSSVAPAPRRPDAAEPSCGLGPCRSVEVDDRAVTLGRSTPPGAAKAALGTTNRRDGLSDRALLMPMRACNAAAILAGLLLLGLAVRGGARRHGPG